MTRAKRKVIWIPGGTRGERDGCHVLFESSQFSSPSLSPSLTLSLSLSRCISCSYFVDLLLKGHESLSFMRTFPEGFLWASKFLTNQFWPTRSTKFITAFILFLGVRTKYVYFICVYVPVYKCKCSLYVRLYLLRVRVWRIVGWTYLENKKKKKRKGEKRGGEGEKRKIKKRSGKEG